MVMTIALSVFLIIWVLWALSLVSLGDYKSIPVFTLGFPIVVAFLAIVCPIVVIFSKTAREVAKRERGEEIRNALVPTVVWVGW